MKNLRCPMCGQVLGKTDATDGCIELRCRRDKALFRFQAMSEGYTVSILSIVLTTPVSPI